MTELEKKFIQAPKDTEVQAMLDAIASLESEVAALTVALAALDARVVVLEAV